MEQQLFFKLLLSINFLIMRVVFSIFLEYLTTWFELVPREVSLHRSWEAFPPMARVVMGTIQVI